MKRRISTGFVIMMSLSLLLIPCITVAQLGFGSSQPEIRASQQILSSNNGRYVFGQISDSDKDRFMLDTHTGRLWRIAESGKIGLYLKAVPYKTGEDTYSIIPQEMREFIQDTDKNE